MHVLWVHYNSHQLQQVHREGIQNKRHVFVSPITLPCGCGASLNLQGDPRLTMSRSIMLSKAEHNVMQQLSILKLDTSPVSTGDSDLDLTGYVDGADAGGQTGFTDIQASIIATPLCCT